MLNHPRFAAALRLSVALVIAVSLFAPARTASAQDTASAKEDLLKSQSLDASGVRDKIRQSGLTPQQIHDRLQARGLSSTILDPYLAGAAGGSGNLSTPPSRDVLAAVAVLVEADQAAQDAATARGGNLVTARGPTTMDGLPVFGLDIFRRNSNQFEPNAAGPVDANYKLGPLDVVVVIMTGETELAHTLEVTRDGFIVIPQVGQVFVANLPLEQATRIIVQKLRLSYKSAGTDPDSKTKVYVSVARLRSNQVFVVGEVSAPSSYQVSAAGTALTALYAAGGPTINGSMRSVQVRRGNKVITTVDMYDYLLRGDNSRDVRLENGDVLFVPNVTKYVGITGEVIRPGMYELKREETLADLLAMTGGFKPTASQRRVQISRVLPPEQRPAAGHERVMIDVDSAALRAGARVPLQAADRVTVFEVDSRIRSRVTVSGGVWAPGPISYHTGMRLSEALAASGGLRDDALKSEVQISRRLNDERRELVRVRLDVPGDAANPLLSDEDEIHVFSLTNFRQERTVTIGGAVRRPVDVPWTEGMTLRSLVLAAGGLDESALLTEVEIARFPVSRAGGALATVTRVALDSTYLLDRDAQGRYLGPPGAQVPTARAPEVPIQPYDQVNILRQPDWDRGGSVTLGGEVRYPGAYAIKNKGERISDVIKRAGGLTTEGFATGAIFTRLVDPAVRAERDRAIDRVRRDREYGISLEKLQVASSAAVLGGAGGAGAQAGFSAAGNEQAAALAAALKSGDDAAERVAIDLGTIISSPKSRTDFILRPGDNLIVPKQPYSVTVRGMVGNPTALAYVRGASMDYYLTRSGGVTKNGDLHRSFVVQPNGQMDAYVHHSFFADRAPEPLAGSTIVIPPREGNVKVPNTNLPLVISAIASLSTAVFAIISLTK